ncbi:caspase family protein [Pseudomonas sp. LT1P18]|uniref:caspase family protein n=1 Tax=Pseudomonas arabinosi TaxID=3398357 RepID=UPI0039EE171A
MAADDYAILVGIARYRDTEQFPTLDGPLNDAERVRKWLIDTELGEGVPNENVLTLTTPEELLNLPLTGWPPQTNWSPNTVSFSQKFNSIAYDDAGKPVRREGRLYLYFSGHGFSLNDDDSPSAALFSADNYGDIHSNLAGTVYAAAIKRARLFKEVVLIMDCCRDVLGNYTYNLPTFNRVENSGAESAKLYALYAAPRRGKSQERELPDSEGKVVGLMTDALLRALKEAPSDVAGRVAGRVLTQVMAFNWTNWYPVRPMPPAPRGVSPDQGDIYFKSRQPLISVEFSSPTVLVPGSTMRLRSELWIAIATVGASSLIWRDTAYSWVQEIPLNQQAPGAAMQFTLVLPPGKHELTIGATVHTFDPEVSNAIFL